MGVMECSRKGCDNILCDRYSTTYGYICQECFGELTELGINADIEAFMASSKRRQKVFESAEERFNDEFPER